MPQPHLILFAGPATWRLARVAGESVTWHALPGVADDVAAFARTVAETLAALGDAGRPTVLMLATADCLAASFDAGGLPGGDRRAMAFRFEEQLPLSAEQVTADFTPVDAAGRVLGVAVETGRVRPVVDALEAAGVVVRHVLPAMLAAAQGVAGTQNDATLLLGEADAAWVSVVTLRGGRATQWAWLATTAEDVATHLALGAGIGSAGHSTETPGADAVTQAAEVSGNAILSGDGRSAACAAAWQDSGNEGAAPIVACGVRAELAQSIAATVIADRLPDDIAARLGAAVLGGTDVPWFDFRRDGLGAADAWRPVRRALDAMLAAAAVLLLAGTVVLLWRGGRYARMAAADDAQAVALFRQSFPGYAVPASVRAVVAAERRKAMGSGVAVGAGDRAYGTALASLREVLAALPDDAGLSLERLSVQDDSLQLSGRVRSIDGADAVAAAARKSGMSVPPPQTRREPAGAWAFVVQGDRRDAPARSTPRAGAAAASVDAGTSP